MRARKTAKKAVPKTAKAPDRRPNTPPEDANIAPEAGMAAVRAALQYLDDPDGQDRGRDWSHYVEPLRESLTELGEMGHPYSWNDTVPAQVIDAFRRADKAVENVMTMTRVDDVKAPLHAALGDFRKLWHHAAEAKTRSR